MTRVLVEGGYAATGGPYDMTGLALGTGDLPDAARGQWAASLVFTFAR